MDYLIIENPFIEKKNLICQKLTIVSVHVDYLIIENLFIEFFFFLFVKSWKKYSYTKNNLLKTVNKQIKNKKPHT